MASVDASIYSHIRPFTMADPVDQTARALQIQGAQNQLREQDRKFSLEDDISGALRDSGGDYSKASQALAARGRGAAAMQMQDKAASQKKADIEQKLKLAEAAASDGIALDAAWRQTVQESGGDVALARQRFAPTYAGVAQRWASMGHQLPDTFDPVKNLASIGQAKEVAQYLKHITTSADAVLREGGENTRHQTPSGSALLTDDRARSEGELNRAVTVAGQNKTDARARDLAEIQREQGRIPQGYRMTQDGKLEAIPGGPADMGKALPHAAVKDLSAAGAAVEDTSRLSGSFQPDYGGKTILGGLSNAYKRVMGDETGQVQWWQDMDALQNQTRHALFGSALTKTELAAWEKTSINPRMDADEIQKNLTRRQQIEARAASKLARSYETAGYNKSQIKELLGTAAQYIDNPAPPTERAKGSKGSNVSSGQVKFLGFE